MEIFDRPVPYTWVAKTEEDYYEAKFFSRDKKFSVSFGKNYPKWYGDAIWQVSFVFEDPNAKNVGDMLGIESIMNWEDPKITLEVFSTVKEILDDWIKEVSPRDFFFTAKEESRKQLYKTFAVQIEKKYNYELKIMNVYNKLHFVFEKV